MITIIHASYVHVVHITHNKLFIEILVGVKELESKVEFSVAWELSCSCLLLYFTGFRFFFFFFIQKQKPGLYCLNLNISFTKFHRAWALNRRQSRNQVLYYKWPWHIYPVVSHFFAFLYAYKSIVNDNRLYVLIVPTQDSCKWKTEYV